jgi:hypothetical protein
LAVHLPHPQAAVFPPIHFGTRFILCHAAYIPQLDLYEYFT